MGRAKAKMGRPGRAATSQMSASAKPARTARLAHARPRHASTAMGALVLVACTRAAPSDAGSAAPPRSSAAPLDAAASEPPPLLHDAAVPGATPAAPLDATVPEPPPSILPREAIDGPHDLLLAPGRPIYYALARRDAGGPGRLVAHLHGMCGPPSYACGKWIGAGTAAGVLVCPTGNARCGDSPVGPPSWEADTWPELVSLMDGDLEASIAKVAAARRGAFTREGAVLTGYSRGAYASVPIVRKHPGRWPFLVLIEADVPVTSAALRAAGVRAVAFVAGEQGQEIAGMRRSVEALTRDGYPARLLVMPRTGHLYAEDMESIMRDALAFVLAYEHDAGAPR